MAVTTNYGWSTPDNTALVKDGASAIRTLGSSVDTTVKALSPGTTAGDVDYYTSSTAKARLAIGSTGQVLTVAGGVPSWATASSGGMTSIASGSFSSTSVVLSSISSSYNYLVLFINAPSLSGGTVSPLRIRLNGDTGANYNVTSLRTDSATPANLTAQTGYSAWAGNAPVALTGNNYGLVVTFPDYAATNSYKTFYGTGWNTNINGSTMSVGNWKSASAINSITLTTENGALSFNGGTYTLYGVK